MGDGFEFDRDVAVAPAGDGRDGRWRGEVGGWGIFGVPNGGYVASIALDALARTVPHPDPLAVTAHFPFRTEPGPVEVEVEPVRAGRRYATAAARAVQEGTVRAHVTATFTDLASSAGPTAVSEPVPAFPPPEECVRGEGGPAEEFLRHLDLRLTPETAAWATTRPSGTAEMAGWVRFADGRPPDARSLLLFADSFPPVVFNLFPTGWVPTFELTVHVRARPAPGWLRCRFRSRYLLEGYFEEDGEIWDERGTLVALSRQLAQVRG